MNKKYIINSYFFISLFLYFFIIDIIVSTQVPIDIAYKLGVITNISCIFFLVSISKLQQLLLLQFEKTRLFFSIVFIITLFLKKNII
jgi:hypothetical protein